MLRDSRVRAVVWVLIGVLAASTVGLILTAAAMTGQIRQTQIEGTPTGKKLVAASDRILDCTDPGGQDHPAGECYKRNQRQIVKVVGDIGAGNILAVVCALNVPNGTPIQSALDQVTDCVADRLKGP